MSCNRNTTRDPINVFNYWNYRKNCIVNYRSSTYFLRRCSSKCSNSNICYNNNISFYKNGWILVQTEGTKDILAVKVSPMLPLPWFVSGKNVTVWNFGFTWSPGNKLLKYSESKYDGYLHIYLWTFFTKYKSADPTPLWPYRIFFK